MHNSCCYHAIFLLMILFMYCPILLMGFLVNALWLRSTCLLIVLLWQQVSWQQDKIPGNFVFKQWYTLRNKKHRQTQSNGINPVICESNLSSFRGKERTLDFFYMTKRVTERMDGIGKQVKGILCFQLLFCKWSFLACSNMGA